MVYAPTAWTHVGDPGIREGVDQQLRAVAQGQNRAVQLRQDQRAEARNLADIASLESQNKRRDVLTKDEINRQNLVEAYYPIMAALALDPKEDQEGQNRRIQEAIEKMNLSPDSPYTASLQEFINETDPDKRTQGLSMLAVTMTKILGYDKKTKSTAPTPTDIDDYVARANEEAIRTLGRELTPGEQNQAALEFKRAQAAEAGAVRLAQRIADVETAEAIARNAKVGEQLAVIATVGDVIEAKGEITPKQKIENAQRKMSANLAKLTGYYNKLNSWGAIQNVKRNSLANAWATTRSSKGGQLLGKILGTEAQSVRKSINNMKPILIQDIRAATEMGARGLDSEKELEFYLQAATDERTDIQSNMAAIAVLDEAFGDGTLYDQIIQIEGINDDILNSLREQGAHVRGKYQQFVKDREAEGKTIINRGVDDKTGAIFVMYSDGTTEEVK